MKNLKELITLAKGKKIKTLTIAASADLGVLEAVSKAKGMGLINAVLVGNKELIEEISKDNNIDISGMEIIDEKDDIKAALTAVSLVREKKADFLMKGMLKTSDILKAVLNKETGIKGKGLLSHVMLYEIPNYHKLLSLTDGGMVPYPTLTDKVAIINNAVSLAHAIGIKEPKVAPICAVEVVNEGMQATMDAAVLSQMNRRGQIKGCIIDGPLALDNAVSKAAAEHKGIKSLVAGEADILLVPNIESGNFLGKSLTYFANAKNAGVVLGALCPIVLVSRADSMDSKLYSIALGSLISQ